MITKLAGLAFDARYAMRHTLRFDGDPQARSTAAQWIAANALAAHGATVSRLGAPLQRPVVFSLRARCFTAAIAAIAAVPALIDATTLPRTWRIALHALGLPCLDRTTAAALAGGASVMTADGMGACELAVDVEAQSYRVRVGPPSLTLVS